MAALRSGLVDRELVGGQYRHTLRSIPAEVLHALLEHAAKAAAIDRYVIVSSMGANPDATGDDTFAIYLRAKGRADAALTASGLLHTIVRPGLLTDDPGTGTITAGPNVGRAEISRDDVAATLFTVLHEPATIGLTFELVSGDTPIDDAIADLTA